MTTVDAARDFLGSGTDPAAILSGLRWEPDQRIVNHFGESVWLAACTTTRQGVERGYLTDCCFTELACEYHLALDAGESPVPWVPALGLVKHWASVKPRFDPAPMGSTRDN